MTRTQAATTTESVIETLSFARNFAAGLRPGTVIALQGNLGSGKTTFIKGIALELGLPSADEVTSPTFTLMHIYPTRIPLYHFDLYRLNSTKEVADIDFEEFSEDPRAITCVEWPEKAPALLPRGTLCVRLEILDETSRRITVGYWPPSKKAAAGARTVRPAARKARRPVKKAGKKKVRPSARKNRR